MSLFKDGNIRNILWDFDGVIMDSMKVRDQGFEIVLKEHPREEIDKLMQYHRENGGLSRYVKFRYFFEKIKNRDITEDQVNEYAEQFSRVMLEKLIDHRLLINETVEFIKRNHTKFKMHVVSGSDQKELRHITGELGIDNYFISIHGSPTPKKQLVKDLLERHNYDVSETILIGDSKNDYEAAIENNIFFVGYNNRNLQELGSEYIESFKAL